jgi:hypothetical protein
MAATAAIFVSKRLQRLTAGLLCLVAMQAILASCTPEPTAFPAGARVAIQR